MVDTRTIYEGVNCRNLPRPAQSLDVLQITGGYSLQVSRGQNCGGLSKRTDQRGNGQFRGFEYNSWKVVEKDTV